MRVGFAPLQAHTEGDLPCAITRTSSKPTAFEVISKRRKGFPSESRVKRGERVVGGSKELIEKLGRNDPCPCNSGRRFQALLHADRSVRWFRPCSLLLDRLALVGDACCSVRAACRLTPRSGRPDHNCGWRGGRVSRSIRVRHASNRRACAALG